MKDKRKLAELNCSKVKLMKTPVILSGKEPHPAPAPQILEQMRVFTCHDCNVLLLKVG